MYQVRNISHGVRNSDGLRFFVTAVYCDIEILAFESLSLVLMMTMKTMIKRGAVKARTGMRTQDPRLAQHCDLGSAFTELAAKDYGKIAFSPPAMRVAVNIPFKQRLGDDGALRRNTESQGPQQPVETD